MQNKIGIPDSPARVRKGENNMATFKQYQKKDGTKAWLFKVHLGTDYVTNKPIKTTRRGFKTKKEAQAALNVLLYEVENDVEPEKEELKTMVNEMYKIWFATYKDTVKETTYTQTDRRMKKYILPTFGKMQLQRITPKIAQKAVNDWASKFGMYTELLRYLTKVCDHAVMLEVIESNPFKKVIKPKRIAKKKRKKLKYYTSEQLKLFLETTEQKAKEVPESQVSYLYYANYDVALFRLLAFSGIRIGESLSVYWSDINFEEQTINISKSLTAVKGGFEISTTKTFSSVRTISLDPQTLAYLRKWKTKQSQHFLRTGFRNKHNLVFCSTYGEIISHQSVYGRSSRIATRAELPNIGLHGFRHTHATLLFESGVNIKEIQHRLGHSDISMTMDVYTHITESTEKQAISTLVQHLGF